MKTIGSSVQLYMNKKVDFAAHVAGNHHQAIIGLFCAWWLEEAKSLGYQIPVLVTGVHAGRPKGSKSGGSVADNLFVTFEENKEKVVGVLEVEVGAQTGFKRMVPRLNKCIESIRKHKKDFPEVRWAILFSPAWDEHGYVWSSKREGERKRREELGACLNDLSRELKIVIFNCLSQQQYTTGVMRQAKWWPMEITVHDDGKGYLQR